MVTFTDVGDDIGLLVGINKCRILHNMPTPQIISLPRELLGQEFQFQRA